MRKVISRGGNPESIHLADPDQQSRPPSLLLIQTPSDPCITCNLAVGSGGLVVFDQAVLASLVW